MMPANRLEYLFHRYLSREITDAEKTELMELLQQPANEMAVKSLLHAVWEQLSIDHRLPDHKADDLFNAILAADTAPRAPVVPMWRRLRVMRLAIAAAVLLLVMAGWFFYYNSRPTITVVATIDPYPNDIPPGKNNAVLLLDDGRRINLDSANNGEVARQGNSVITKKNGLVLYEGADRQSAIRNRQLAYNTISTARGNQYQLVLPDGSTVWLNAESSVRFPVAFTGNERRVEVTGEVYLVVKHNSKMPFTVVANGVEVQDLGTEFNVNAYDGELGVTVVEGKIAVNGQREVGSGQLAVPGQQVTVNSNGAMKLIKDADVDAAIAWKNGQFMFAGNSIQSVMRQLERWYDIDVSYAPNVSTEEFVGTINRFSNISAVLKMLEKTGTVHFEVKGRKVVVK